MMLSLRRRIKVYASSLCSVGPFLLVTLLVACRSKLLVASWSCESSENLSLDGGAGDAGTSFEFPWSTGFENGFCGYWAQDGYCYATGAASYDVVDHPVHSGQYAAAFTVVGDSADSSTNARCFRQGELPKEAYYGAWYYIPSVASNSGVWNLFHFQGRSSSTEEFHGLMDVSLVNNADGSLRLMVYEFLSGTTPVLSTVMPVPIGAWFHIQVFLKRAADSTGELAVYQDGVSLLQLENLITDDSVFGQWYVGNYATALTPVSSTLYVDDVTIGSAL